MAEVHPVLPPGRRRDRAVPVLVAGAAVALVLVVLKPWGGDLPVRGPSSTPFVRSTPGVPDATPVPPGQRAYDPALFGRQEPEPAWELWPAGYVFEFGLAGPVRVGEAPDGGDPPVAPPDAGSPDATGGPVGPTPAVEEPVASQDPSAAPSPGASAGTPPEEPVVAWWGTSDLTDRPVPLGAADHLVTLGLNTPADVRVAAMRLWRFDARPRRVALERLRPPWPIDTFHVLAMPGGPGTVGAWSAGRYRLDVLLAGDGGVVSIPFELTGGVPPETPFWGALDPTAALPGPVPDGTLVLLASDGRPASEPLDPAVAPCPRGLLWAEELASAFTPAGTCRAVPADRVPGLAVATGGAELRVRAIEPLEADVPLVTVERDGVLVAVPAAGPLAEGVYEVALVRPGGTTRWYVRAFEPLEVSGGPAP